jgi:hypothetical protein
MAVSCILISAQLQDISVSILIGICIYWRSFDPRKGYCPLDVEHVISIHNTMRYRSSNGQELTENCSLLQYKISWM